MEGLGQIDPSYTLEGTRSESEAALAELERLGDAAGIRQAKLAVARPTSTRNCGACHAVAEELRGAAAGFPFIDRAKIVMNISMSCFFGPTPASARPRSNRARELVAGSLISQAILSTIRTGLLAMQGFAEESRAAARRADELWDEVGSTAERLAMGQPVGEAQRFLGRPDVAEGIFRAIAEQYAALGETGFNSTVSAMLALSLCDQAKFDEAEVHATRSRELAAVDDFASQAAWRLAQAQVLSYRGTSTRRWRSPTRPSRSTVRPTTSTGRARVRDPRVILLAAGRVPEAKEAFAEALELYEPQGTVPGPNACVRASTRWGHDEASPSVGE